LNNKHWEALIDLQCEQPRSLGMELERLAVQSADKIALTYKNRKFTYKELNCWSNRYSNYFRQQGLKKGDVVALLMENCPEYLMLVSGLSKLGVIVALINTGIRRGVLARDINLSEAKAIIVGHKCLDIFLEAITMVRLKSPAKFYVAGKKENGIPDKMLDLDMLVKSASDENPSTTTSINSKDQLVYLYTPGQSGLRKAVAVKQERWLKHGHFLSCFASLNENTVQYMCLPLYYHSGFIAAYSSMIISGSTMVLCENFSVQRFWQELRVYNANFVIAVGQMARYLYNQPEKPDDIDNPLEIMISNGMRSDLIESFRRRFGLKHIMEAYATTEGVGLFINYEETPSMCGNLSLNGRRQGEVVRYDFSQDKIVYQEDGRAQKCLPGEVGLLLCEINELNSFPGYINDPEATELCILRNVFGQGDQYFKTGDLMQLHENGYISYVERLGDAYRCKGITVSAIQVADVIKKFYGGIEECLVYPVKIPWVEGSCGMASLKLLEGENLNWSEFSKHINQRMPEHARPIFIRITQNLNWDQAENELKKSWREEGFNIDVVKDPMYFLDPQLNYYVPLTREIYNRIIDQTIKF
jgi:citronellyl-CoA synthetase